MRILHVLDHSVPLHSDYSFRTLATLVQQRKLGWETEHITGPKHEPIRDLEEEVDGFRFHRTRASTVPKQVPGLQHLMVIWDLERRLRQVAQSVRPDILHAHSPALNGVAALRVGRRLGIPVVYELRALWEDGAVDHGTTREGSLRYRLSHALETYVLKRADAVTTISEGLRRNIIERGIAPGKLTVIPNAVDVEQFGAGRPPNAGLRARLELTENRVIGFIGSYYAYEGLALLLEAVPLILQRDPSVRVVLVGGGFQEDNLKEQAVRLGIVDKVRFVGRVPHSEVADYYALIDVLIYPRLPMRLTELVTPLKPLEAMAQGALVVASDVGGHRELIRDQHTGILFHAGDVRDLAASVLRLLAQPEQWSALRANARDFVTRERGWSEVVRRYQPIYEGLTA